MVPASRRSIDRVTVFTAKVICATRDDFSAKYLSEFPNGGFFVPTRRRPEPGEPAMLSLRIGSRETPVLLRASVRWIRPGKIVPKVQAGVAVEFLATEAPGRDHLLSIARHDHGVHSVRRHPRIPVDLPIQWSVPGIVKRRFGLLEDISFGGASVRTKESIAEGADIFVTVFPPGATVATTMSARVVWTVEETAFGAAWRARDAGGIRRIKELVRRLEQVLERAAPVAATAVSGPRSP